MQSEHGRRKKRVQLLELSQFAIGKIRPPLAAIEAQHENRERVERLPGGANARLDLDVSRILSYVLSGMVFEVAWAIGPTELNVTREGYRLADATGDESTTTATVNADTRFDIELVRR